MLFIAITGCAPPQKDTVSYVTTIHPLYAILQELVATRAEVHRLVPPGASPHTFSLKPSDARLAQTATALFYVDEHLDGWATKVSSGKHVQVFPFVPERYHHAAPHAHTHTEAHQANPHFWSNPMAVAAILPTLTEKLTELDPDGKEIYHENAARFLSELRNLDEEILSKFEDLEDRSLILFHPSWDYFLNHYGISTAAMIESAPGKEATPRHLKSLIALATEKNVHAILTETQLPRAPAELIAEETGLPLYEIDPLGGVPGRETYAELIRYNTSIIRESLD
jgi:zinc transport system substrate-binding protein